MTERNKSAKKDQIVTTIVGGSMVKDIYGWKLSDNNKKVVVKHFRASTTEDMMTYIKPPLKRKPDGFIIHVEAKDLRSNQDPKAITRNIVEVANDSKTDTNKVLISSIVPRRENLNGKGCLVNIFLKKICMENDFIYVNHDNIKTRHHPNYGGIHLNTLGSKILADHFVFALIMLT